MARNRGTGVLVALALALLAAALSPGAARADGAALHALARLDPVAAEFADDGSGIAIRLPLSQPVPFRVFFLDTPPRLVVDFREVDFGGADPMAAVHSKRITGLSWGPFTDGWSRMVAELDGPMALTSAEEKTTGAMDGALIRIALRPTDTAAFQARVAADRASDQASAGAGDWRLPPPASVAAAKTARQTGDRPLRVTIDPGHGGIDPGAQAGRVREAAVVLTFAMDLAERLKRAGMEVELTRRSDQFVPLETRISVARASGADLFLSIHADALAEGEAAGATIYKMASEASDLASEQLAERHDRADILAGVDLTGNDDEVAGVLLDLARQETQPRADKLAVDLGTALQAAGVPMHRHPIQEAAFSVLKSADIPSLLIEIGFLSSPEDRARIDDPAARARMVAAIQAGIEDWAATDAAEAQLLRQ